MISTNESLKQEWLEMCGDLLLKEVDADGPITVVVLAACTTWL